jgi:hypothetical protein
MSSAYRVTVVVLVLGVAMLAPASGQARKRHRTCYPAHTKTLVASARARVFGPAGSSRTRTSPTAAC